MAESSQSSLLPPKFRLKVKIPKANQSANAASSTSSSSTVVSSYSSSMKGFGVKVVNGEQSLVPDSYAVNGLPSPAATASSFKRPSSPSSSSTAAPFSKRWRLTYRVEDSGTLTGLTPISTSLDIPHGRQYVSQPDNRLNILNSAPQDLPSPTLTPDTKLRALQMIRWAISNNANLKNEYIPISILGWGGCGAVFEARSKSDSELVAIKIMYKSNKRTGTPNEIEILSSLSHPSIVQYLTKFEDKRTWYLVMERFGKIWNSPHENNTPLSLASPLLIDQHISSSSTSMTGTSSSLFEFIDHSKGGKVPQRSLRPLFKQICQALVFLHSQNIVHGDLKEENILIGTVKGRLIAKLCDFGHSCQVNQSNPKMRLYGTRVLTPPEMLNHLRCEERGVPCQDSLQVGFKQDVWALGIVFWTMLHGSLPPENEKYINGDFNLSKCNYYPTSFSAITDTDCLDLLQRMLWIDPKQRLSAQQVLAHPYFK